MLLRSDDPIGAISSNLIERAEIGIPKSSANLKQLYYPWLNDNSRTAIQNRNDYDTVKRFFDTHKFIDIEIRIC